MCTYMLYVYTYRICWLLHVYSGNEFVLEREQFDDYCCWQCHCCHSNFDLGCFSYLLSGSNADIQTWLMTATWCNIKIPLIVPCSKQLLDARLPAIHDVWVSHVYSWFRGKLLLLQALKSTDTCHSSSWQTFPQTSSIYSLCTTHTLYYCQI